MRTPKMLTIEQEDHDHDGREVLRSSGEHPCCRVPAGRLNGSATCATGSASGLEETAGRRSQELPKAMPIRRNGSRLHHQDTSSRDRIARHGPERLAQTNILSAGVRHHRSQFSVGQRAGDRQEPVINQAPISSAGESTLRAISAETDEDADPIIEPITSMVGAGQADFLRARAFAGGEGDCSCGFGSQ